MTRHEATFSRRSLLQAGGALVISIGVPVTFESVLAADNPLMAATKPPLTPDQLSSYLAVNADGTISI
jgi:nicotinate dehydrogenase subunit B